MKRYLIDVLPIQYGDTGEDFIFAQVNDVPLHVPVVASAANPWSNALNRLHLNAINVIAVQNGYFNQPRRRVKHAQIRNPTFAAAFRTKFLRRAQVGGAGAPWRRVLRFWWCIV